MDVRVKELVKISVIRGPILEKNLALGSGYTEVHRVPSEIHGVGDMERTTDLSFCKTRSGEFIRRKHR